MRRVALLVCLLPACRSPTEITVDVYSEVDCAKHPSVGLSAAATFTELASKALTTTSDACDPATRRVGSVVLQPSGSNDVPIAFQVATRNDSMSPDTCAGAGAAPGCIVARRQIRFSPHDDLDVRVDLRLSCLDVACPVDQTCVNHACVPATLPDGCGNGRPCVEGSLTGGSDAGVGEAGADGGDAGTNGGPLACGDVSGLAPGAPWPMMAGCPTKLGRSAFRGPQTNQVRWTFADTSSGVNTVPIVGPDGTIYFGSNAQVVYALEADGGVRFKASTAGVGNGNVNGSAGALGADGNLYVSAANGFYAVAPDGGATPLVMTPAVGDEFQGSAVIGPDGTVYMGAGNGQLYSFKAGVSASTQPVAPALGSPLIAPNATLYVVGGVKGGGGNLNYGNAQLFSFQQGNPAVALPWHLPLGGNATDAMMARDGNLYVGVGSALFQIAPGGTLGPSVPLQAQAVDAPVEAPDGTIVLRDINGGVYTVDPHSFSTAKTIATVSSASYGMGLTIDADGTLYLMSGDQTFRAIGLDGTPKWTLALLGNSFSAGAIAADGTLYFGASAVGGSYLYAVGP